MPMRVLQLPSGCKSFKEMFDTLQSYLKKLCGHDDFVTGILSKQKGQALRVAAVMNALFSLDDKYKLKALIDEDAVKAAIDFVQVCGDHASFLSGRQRLAEVVAAMDTSKPDACSMFRITNWHPLHKQHNHSAISRNMHVQCA